MAHHDMTQNVINVIKTFSLKEATSMLDSILFKQSLGEQFKYDLVDVNVTTIQQQLLEVIKLNSENVSTFSKLAGVLSFQNILTVLLVLTVFLFLIVFAHELLGRLFYAIFKIVVSRPFIYFNGYMLSFVYLYFRTDDDKGDLNKLFIFDQYSSMFGIMLFAAVTCYLGYDISDGKTHSEAEQQKQLIQFIIWQVSLFSSYYHMSDMIGLFTTMYTFYVCGFVFGSFWGGFYTGFDDKYALERCTILAFVLNIIYVIIRNTSNTSQNQVFVNFVIDVYSSGITFWATLVGLIGLLILQSEYRTKNHGLMKVITFMTCLTLMWAGNVMYISSYKNLGGTFMTLFILDIQREMLSIMRSHLMLYLLIMSINLYALREVVKHNPEYFII